MIRPATSKNVATSIAPTCAARAAGFSGDEVPGPLQRQRQSLKPWTQRLVRAAASNGSPDVAASAESGTSTAASEAAAPAPDSQQAVAPAQALGSALKAAWEQGVAGPLSNFGIGKRSIKEGGVGLFMMSGVVLLGLVVGWVQGVRVRAQSTRYQAIFEFGQACGIAVGTPVRIRGVDVGSVVGVRPSLEKIDAVVEIIDENVVIPRNALIEVNQSGLISETLIDITPQLPMPVPTFGPAHPRCSEEGLIVCDR